MKSFCRSTLALQHHHEGIQFLYNGQYGIVTDANGLYQMRSRYYNADIKRFMNQDVLYGSVTDSQSMNRYSYAQGNPINALDPFGLCPFNIFTADFGHGILDLLGFIPGVGEIADIINAVWYLEEGNYGSAAASLLSALPGVGSFLGNGLKVGFKFSKGAIKAANIIEGTCKVVSNSYQLGTSTYDIGQKVGKIYYDTQVLGLDVDSDDIVGIAIDVFSAAVSGRGLANDLKSLNKVRAAEVSAACFIAGTPVMAQDEDGEAAAKPIEEIRIGDKVYSTDPATGKSGFKEVVQLYVKETDVLIHIDVGGEEITTTPDHPFRVGSIWISAKDLRAGDLLTLADGSKAAIDKIQTETLAEPVTVYNFEVADFHTYYVGNSQVLVHNDCSAGGEGNPKMGSGGNQSIVAGEVGGLSSKGASKAEILSSNRIKGKVYEQQEFSKFKNNYSEAQEQITILTPNGVKIRVDAIGLDSNGNVVINEFKSSATAPYTFNQRRAYPQDILTDGGVVVGKGKGSIFKGGYQIPAGTAVTTIRPS